jgi:SAM-dependent methyltransferase
MNWVIGLLMVDDMSKSLDDQLSGPESPRESRYILGHSFEEISRLERQGRLFAEETDGFIRRAGLSSGMTVLDIGCGVGDVSLIAANIVGETGRVIGIDRAAGALERARLRAELIGCGWLEFRQAEVSRLETTGLFDAVVGRFILLHVPDTVGLLNSIRSRLRPGGLMAFLEFDIETAAAVPELPLLTRCLDWIAQTYRRDRVEPNMGSHLYATFRAAGLTPEMMGSCRIERPTATDVFTFAAETVRSLLPRIIALKLATAEEVEIDTLAARLSTLAVEGDHCIFLPRLVGAWSVVE